MGFTFRRRKRLGKGLSLNVGKRGASVSKRKGRVTVNSRRGVRVRLGKGISYKL